MINRIKLKLFLVIASLALCLSLFSLVPKSLADSGYIYLSPSTTSSVENGQSFVLGLRINPGTTVNSVQATVTYDTSVLQFDSDSLGDFPTCVQNSGGGGSVNLACAILGSGTASDSLIANITFTALTGSGSTNLNVTNAEAANAGTYTNPGSDGASVNFYTPPAPTPPAGSSGSSGGTSSKTSSGKSSSSSAGASTATPATSTTQAAAATPTVSLPKVSISSVSSKTELTKAIIRVRSSYGVQTLIKYGISPTAMNELSSTSISEEVSTLTLANLEPSTTYYYQAVDQINGTTVATGSIKKFTTSGFTLSIIVLDSHYHPLANQVVYLHSTPIKGVTNSSGVVTFYNVPSGIHDLDYTANNHTYSEVVYVSNNIVVSSKSGTESAPPQSQSVVLTGYTESGGSYDELVLLGLVLILIILIFIRIPSVKARFRVKKSEPPTANS